jgi:hypothetical protein
VWHIALLDVECKAQATLLQAADVAAVFYLLFIFLTASTAPATADAAAPAGSSSHPVIGSHY